MMELNQKQQMCVEHLEGPMLVLAGAGSGKTRVVIERIKRLIHLGVPAESIVAVTFTNKAASEMAHRIKSSTEQNVLAATFHSLCARILRESIHHIGFSRSFSIFDQQDSENCLKMCLKNKGIDDARLSYKELKHTFSGFKNALLLPEDIEKDPTSNVKGLILELYRDYQSTLKGFNALDFDDLLVFTVKLFKDHPQVLRHYQELWQFLLVDEYQDTNYAQYILIKQLSGYHHRLFAVGDPDQSIYSFRGARISNILQFENDFPEAKVITLDHNYRSTQRILKAANGVIAWNKKRYEKNLFSTQDLGDKIQLYYAESDHDEARFVLRHIEHLTMQKKIPYSALAIFYRTNAQSRNYEDELLKWGIPYQIIGGISFYQRKEIKDAIAFLRVLIHDNDFISFERVINIPKRGIGPTALASILHASQTYQLPVMRVLEKVVGHELFDVKLNSKQLAGITAFMQARYESKKVLKAPLPELISTTLNAFDYLTYLKQDPLTEADRKENLAEFLTKATEFEKEFPEKTLDHFLEEISLKGSHDEEGYKDAVKLMTFHNSKGLEFPYVFMVGMEEDLFPHINCKDKEEDIEEERRLCYVGMTRAKNMLHLSCARHRTIWGNSRLMIPSRFLEEIPADLVESNRRKREAEPMQQPTSEESFSRGTTVFHKTFGNGIIKNAYQGSLGLTLEVYFHELHELKTLVAKFAKLIKTS
jgi:DNA helicase-2/ATP-dependent DNA helicase PcrA